MLDAFSPHTPTQADAHTALLICGWWLWFNALWLDTYSVSGQIVRNCLPLGLHMSEFFEPLSSAVSLLPPPRDTTEAETRRNTFWLAYAFERLSGCGNGWTTTLDDVDVSQLLPTSWESFSLGVRALAWLVLRPY
jgi:hypothetical protein